MSKHLIILPCHSIWSGGPTMGSESSEWALASFQIRGRDHLCFKNHIATATSLLEQDTSSFLVISGGQTKRDSGPVSELYSYYQLARKMYPDCCALLDRATTEEFARDSFENVLFLICRFYEVHKNYPVQVSVVGFEFKRARFVDLHLRAALRFLSKNISYHGNAPTPEDADADTYFEELRASEAKFAYTPFSTDLYGVRPPLSDKRAARNPFNRYHGYASSNPQLRAFFSAMESGGDNDTVRLALPSLMPWME